MGIKCPKCLFNNPDDTLYCGNCAAPLHPSEKMPSSLTKTLETPKEELTRGTTFAGRYELIEELGKGGMGRVYKVFDTKIKEEVALKLLKPEISGDEKTIERFTNELKFSRKIVHKNVCRMYDLNEEEGTYYIIMEYVPGEDLNSFIKRAAPLSIGKSISIAKQICKGLSEAHSAGVVHRDLKPGNIMIDKGGNARIMDFGIARSLKAEGITGEGLIIGTPQYMSPEQVEGKKAGQCSDIYSLGIILYEMMTGRVPFEGDTPLSIALKHKTEIPKDPREINEQVPEELSHVILKCMEKDKEKRYQKVEGLLSELSDIEKGIPITDRVLPKKKPTTSREITVQFKLKKLLIPVFVVIAIVIVGFILFRFTALSKIFGTSSSPATSPETEEYFTAANNFWRDKSYLKSIDQFKKILDIEPKNFEAQFSIASILKEQSKFDEAIPEYEKAISLDNQDPRSYIHLAEIFEQKKNPEKAVDYYKKYLDAAPKSSNINLINQKINDLEALFRPQPPPEQSKPISVPSKTKKEQDQGIKAFNQGDYDQCIKLMEELLKVDPENTSAQYFLDESKKKKREKLVTQEIRNKLKTAQDAFQKENYQECINQIKKVLRLAPNNAQARRLLNLAKLKIAPQQIKDLVSQYIESLNNNNLLTFYQRTCSAQFYQKVKRDTEIILNLYDKLQSFASNINIRFKGINQVEVSFSHIITGVSKKDGIKQVLLDGTTTWEMQKQVDTWKITDISFRRAEKK